MTHAENDLTQYLTLLRDITNRNQELPKRWVYKGPADLLLREAKYFKPPAAPTPWEHSEFKMCFRNAAMYAATYNLRYIEGYALSMIPVHHGWCADADDNVIEVTWNHVGSLYYGVEFEPMQVKRGSVLFNERSLSVYRRLIKKEHGK